MYALLSGLYNHYFVRVPVRVLLLGLDDSGKSALSQRLRLLSEDVPRGEPSLDLRACKPTRGLNIVRVRTPGARLVLWDVSGGSQLRSLWKNYYGEADVVVWVCDPFNAARLSESLACLRGVLEAEELRGKPVLLLLSKGETGDAEKSDAMNWVEEIKGTDRRVGCLSCSAGDGSGCKEVLEWLEGAAS